jgi:hypothetical protein
LEPNSFASPPPGLEALAQMGSAEKNSSKTIRNALTATLGTMPPPKGPASVHSSLTNSSSMTDKTIIHKIVEPEEDDRLQLEKWTLKLMEFMNRKYEAQDTVRKELYQSLVDNAQTKVNELKRKLN